MLRRGLPLYASDIAARLNMKARDGDESGAGIGDGSRLGFSDYCG